MKGKDATYEPQILYKDFLGYQLFITLLRTPGARVPGVLFSPQDFLGV